MAKNEDRVDPAKNADREPGPNAIPDWRGLSGTRRIEVSWGDCDAAGVVFYPRYYAWFDACTHALLTQAGLDHHSLRNVHGFLGTPLVAASARFLSPATFGDVLAAESYIAKVVERGFTVNHRFFIGERLIVEGEEIRVWVKAGDEINKRFRTVDPGLEIRACLAGNGPGAGKML